MIKNSELYPVSLLFTSELIIVFYTAYICLFTYSHLYLSYKLYFQLRRSWADDPIGPFTRVKHASLHPR